MTSISRRRLVQGAVAAAIAPSLFSGCASKKDAPLIVGGLPVTCNLTLPVACVAKAKSNEVAKGSGPIFEYSKYNGWPEIKESLITGRLQAAYMLAPLIMDVADRNVPVKIVSLGHRSGAVIMVR